MLSAVLRRLKELSVNKRSSSEEKVEVEELLRVLRRNGFSIREIVTITGGRWKYDSVKKYTRGEKVSKQDTRDRALRLFTRFIENGVDLKDAQDILDIKERIELARTSEEELLSVLQYCQSSGVKPRELVQIKDQVQATGQGIFEVGETAKMLQTLALQGFTYAKLLEFSLISIGYGGLPDVIKTLEAYRSGNAVIRANLLHEKKRDELLLEKQNLQENIAGLSHYYEITKKLINEHGFTHNLFAQLLELATKHGQAAEILNILNMYNDLQEIQNEVLDKQNKITFLEVSNAVTSGDLAATQYLLRQANESIGALRGDFEKSRILTLAYTLLSDSQESQEEPNAVYKLMVAMFDGVRRYIEKNQDNIPNHSRLDYSVNLLRRQFLDQLKG